MAYIGNGRTLLVFGPNVQDDLVPDGITNTFTLSQEVPGGYEGNVIVVRKRYLQDQLILENGLSPVSLVSPNKITTLNPEVAAALSVVQVPATDNDASNIHITNSLAGNDGSYRVSSIEYFGDELNIFIVGTFTDEYNAPINISWGRTTEWEVLEPEIDYVIGGTGNDLNKILTFSAGYIPSIDDKIYVIHRGEATYNFVPTQASVGPDQLQHNLRNFVCNRYVGDGSTTNFALTQEAINSKTLLVSLDGVQKDGDDPDQLFVGDWELDVGGLGITFHTAPANGVKIKILHLSFSTVSRRASLSPGQANLLAPGTVDNAALATDSVTSDKIAPGAVTNTDIGSDAVDGSKILLNNEENLRGKDFGGTARNLLKINASNETVLNSQNDTLIQSNGTTRVRLDSVNNALVSETNNDIALGTPAKKYSALYVQGTTRTGATEVDSIQVNANATVTGNIVLPTPGATVDGVDLTALQASLTALQAQVNALVPTGTMRMWMVDGPAPAGYLLCQGQAVSRATFSTLFGVIGTTFGNGDGSTTFNLPDLRQRFPIGKSVSGGGLPPLDFPGSTATGWGTSGGKDGFLDHTHTGGSHSHGMTHTHTLPAHYHGMGSGADLNITQVVAKNTTTNSGHFHSMNFTSDFGVVNPGSHSHVINGSINSTDINHTHSGTTDGVGNHEHQLNGTKRSSGNTASQPYNWGPENVGEVLVGNPSAPGGAILQGDIVAAFGAGAHSHTFGTGYMNSNVTHSHTHSLGIQTPNTHTHSIIGNTATENSHTHSIAHTHPSSEFAGRIGLVTGGADGNATMSSGPASASITDSGGAVATTSNNPAFLVVHFIIKT